MSILVVGASHRSAPVELLERLALDAGQASKLRAAALDTAHVTEAVVLATCNRVEIYAKVDRFHGSVEDLTALLVDNAGMADPADIMASLYVHYDAGAVAHLFSVATGLESMVVGEGQILGQVREALRDAQVEETVGVTLNPLFQHALRVGKRAHSRDRHRRGRAGRSSRWRSTWRPRWSGDIATARVCIVGAGSVAALAASSVRRAGGLDIVVLSRTFDNAQRVASHVDGRAAELVALTAELADSDVLISCTGATGVVVDAARPWSTALSARVGPDRPLAIVDLALPHDVDLEVAELPGVTPHRAAGDRRVAGPHAGGRRGRGGRAVIATPRSRRSRRPATRTGWRPPSSPCAAWPTGVIASELERLWARLPELTERQRDEIAKTLRREADKLLHEPTVRIQQFAGRVPESSYAAALAELFALDPAAVEAVSGQRDDPGLGKPGQP